MAHLLDEIPWHSLADLLNPNFDSAEESPPDFVLKDVRISARDEIVTRFVKAMEDAIRHHSITERSKYPDHQHSGNFTFEDVLISAEAAKNIRPTVRRWRRIYYRAGWSVTEEGINSV